METVPNHTPSTTGPVGWDVPEVLKTLVSPLTFCGLVAVVMGSLGAIVLHSDLSAELKLAGFMAALCGEVACLFCVIHKVTDSKTLVIDADYHKRALLARFIEGTALNDLVDDRVLSILERNGTGGEIGPALVIEKRPQESDSVEGGTGQDDRRSGPTDRRVLDRGRRKTDVL